MTDLLTMGLTRAICSALVMCTGRPVWWYVELGNVECMHPHNHCWLSGGNPACSSILLQGPGSTLKPSKLTQVFPFLLGIFH